ncbi:MAG: hypothetical protein GXO35_01220, partial [Gammaproteobacteria bacterium]|nr:hypothetical protein [Gammaproteobacteria bacterium]
APHQADKQLIADTLILMDQSDLDFHYFFQLLQYFDTEQHALFINYLPDAKAWRSWVTRYRNRIQAERYPKDSPQLIARNTPKIILRTYILQTIIEAAEQQNYQPLSDWMQWISTPYQLPDSFTNDAYKSLITPPLAHQKRGALSCSS